MTEQDPTRLQDCLRLLASPQELPDDHRSIAYLMHHKHRHAIVCTLVRPGQAWPDRFTKAPPRLAQAVRRWELLPGYEPERVEILRCQGRMEADSIRRNHDRREWPDVLAAIDEPLVRDTASDVLRGWC